MTIFEKLNGKKLDVNYETGFHFQMTYLSEQELKWEAKHEVEPGEAPEGIEPYCFYEIAEGIYNINWIEKDGMTASQILDFNTHAVYAFLTWAEAEKRGGREQLLQKGSFRLL